MDTVMLVDDNPAIREIFTVYLEHAGFTAFAVAGGMECMELLKTITPHLILLDMMMEPMDGWDTLLAIRNTPGTVHIPVAIITGKRPTYPDIVQYGGMIEDFIMKPVDFGAVARSLKQVIEHDRDLCRQMLEKKDAGEDPALLAEYGRLLRMVQITHTLIRRFNDPRWADPLAIGRYEEELIRLHTRLKFPDRILQRDGAG